MGRIWLVIESCSPKVKKYIIALGRSYEGSKPCGLISWVESQIKTFYTYFHNEKYSTILFISWRLRRGYIHESFVYIGENWCLEMLIGVYDCCWVVMVFVIHIIGKFKAGTIIHIIGKASWWSKTLPLYHVSDESDKGFLLLNHVYMECLKVQEGVCEV